MSCWDLYRARVDGAGGTKRGAYLLREKRYIKDKLVDSLSYNTVTIDGVEQHVSIRNLENTDEKNIISLPDEPLYAGSMVEWMGSKWIITEADANNTVYTKAKMEQCNYLLKWVDKTGAIKTQWSIISDGTKYLVGEIETKGFVAARGDGRIQVIVPRNTDTAKLCRGTRFLIDDEGSDVKQAFELTKPLKVGKVYNGNGVFSFIFHEVASTDDDNFTLGIADYYKYFPRPTPQQSEGQSDQNENEDAPQPTVASPSGIVTERHSENTRGVWI